jgi:Ca2+-transporting ATPase
MRKSMSYVTAIHVPIALLALLPPLLGWPILLFPLHIVFLELVIDPACTLAFESEPEEPDLMRRPPRPRSEALLGRPAIVAALLRGLWAGLLVAACYALAVHRLPETAARATGFSALLLCNIGLLLAHRQRDGAVGALTVPNPMFMIIAGAALVVLAIALYLPDAAELLRFTAPPPAWIGLATATAALMLLGLQMARKH